MKLFSSRWKRDWSKGLKPNSRRAASASATLSATCTFAGEKELQQLVEEQAPALRRANALPVPLQQALLFRLTQRLFDRRQRQAGSFAEQGRRKPVRQAQRIQH